MPQSHSIAVLSFFLLRKGVTCHSPIQQLYSLLLPLFFQQYMYLFGYDFNDLKQRQGEYFFFIEILTSVLTIQSYLFLSLNFFLNSYLPSNYFNVSIFRWSLWHFYEIIRLLLCFFSGLYIPPKHSEKNIRSASEFFIAGNPFVKNPGFPFLHFRLI